jgi:tryptophan synthase beta subunit
MTADQERSYEENVLTDIFIEEMNSEFDKVKYDEEFRKTYDRLVKAYADLSRPK